MNSPLGTSARPEALIRATHGQAAGSELPILPLVDEINYREVQQACFNILRHEGKQRSLGWVHHELSADLGTCLFLFKVALTGVVSRNRHYYIE